MRKRTNEPLRANVKRTMKKKEIKELANKKIMKLYHHGPCACELRPALPVFCDSSPAGSARQIEMAASRWAG